MKKEEDFLTAMLPLIDGLWGVRGGSNPPLDHLTVLITVFSRRP